LGLLLRLAAQFGAAGQAGFDVSALATSAGLDSFGVVYTVFDQRVSCQKRCCQHEHHD
jgi:outer membrane protein W